MDMEMLRMVEGIIIAFGGILSIVLGYRLFMVVSANNSVSGGNFKSALFNITLSKVAPGVFFALFGAYILATGINTQISTKRAPATAPLVALLKKQVDTLKDGDTKDTLNAIAKQLESSAGSNSEPLIESRSAQ